MKLKLKIGDQEKTFIPPFISARMLKNTIKLSDIVDTNSPDEEMIDSMAAYIVKIFSNQFTLDELLDGIASDQLVQTFIDCVQEVVGKLKNKMEQFKSPNG